MKRKKSTRKSQGGIIPNAQASQYSSFVMPLPITGRTFIASNFNSFPNSALENDVQDQVHMLDQDVDEDDDDSDEGYDWNMPDGLEWQDIHVEETKLPEWENFFTKLELMKTSCKAKLIGVNANDALYSGSRHSAKDFCRYVMALQQSTGTSYHSFHYIIHCMF